MADFDPNAKVQELLSLGRETEWLECKTAGNNYNFENLGKYFSALSEGRYPRLHISAQVAVLSKQKAKYLHNRGLDEDYYAKLVLDHIAQFGAITRQEADDLLFPKLSSLLNNKQKKNKVARILSIVLKGRIKNTGTRIKPCYIILNSDNKK